MALPWQHKGAPRKGAPFAFGLALLCLLLPWVAEATECGLQRSDETVVVSYVYDGDTVKLTDGRKIRFIGINTPEINHRGGTSEPFAKAARKRLQQLLDTAGKQLQLRYGQERHDRYGRTLAHPYLQDGRSINTLLLQQGLATTLVIPPNTWNLTCYQGVEERARRQGLGIWSLPRYQPIPLAALYKGAEGYHIVRAEIEHVGESRHSVWLDLNGPGALRIPRADLHYFDDVDVHALVGKEVVARGWWHRDKKGRWRMTLRHPAALERR